MATQMTLFFNQLDKGFSETWYHPNDSPQQLANETDVSLYNLAIKFRHITTYFRAVRFSKVAPTAGGKESVLRSIFPRIFGTRGTITGGPDEGPDLTAASAVYQVEASNAKTKRVWFRGLADEDVQRSPFGIDRPSAELNKMILAYTGRLRSLGFGIRRTVLPPEGGAVWRKVAVVNLILGGSVPERAWFFLTNALPEFAVGDFVVFNGIPSALPYFPRQAEILGKTTVDGTVNYMIAYRLPGGFSVAPKNLRVTALVRAVSAMTDAGFKKLSDRKTGRPFGLSRGRVKGFPLRR